MNLLLSPRAMAVLRELIYTASETLHDGLYYVDGKTSRSAAVKEAEKELHELTIAVNNGLLKDVEKFQTTLERLDIVLANLAKVGISPTSLMVHRDYASEPLRKKAAIQNQNPVPALSRPRLVVTNHPSD